jgi:hypothetical protein
LTERFESVIEMNETPLELEARNVKRLEHTRRKMIDNELLWERRKAGNHLGADRVLAALDADLDNNTELLDLARQRLLALSSKPDRC